MSWEFVLKENIIVYILFFQFTNTVWNPAIQRPDIWQVPFMYTWVCLSVGLSVRLPVRLSVRLSARKSFMDEQLTHWK